MKATLKILLFFSIYAIANTCTEATFKVNSLNFFINNNIQLDSIYETTDLGYHNETTSKYTYQNTFLEKIVLKDKTDNKQEEKVTSINVYNTLDESILTKKDIEMLFSVSSSKDTTFIHRKDFQKGFLLYEYIYKITDDYISTLSNAYNWSFTDSIYDFLKNNPEFNSLLLLDNPENFIKENLGTIFYEELFRNDSIIETEIRDYNTNKSDTSYTYTISDSNDDSKCFLYFDDDNYPQYTNTFQKNDKGFVLKHFRDDGDHYKEYFVLFNNEKTTHFKSNLSTIKKIHKARYFDLLGRYKFSKPRQ